MTYLILCGLNNFFFVGNSWLRGRPLSLPPCLNIHYLWFPSHNIFFLCWYVMLAHNNNILKLIYLFFLNNAMYVICAMLMHVYTLWLCLDIVTPISYHYYFHERGWLLILLDSAHLSHPRIFFVTLPSDEPPYMPLACSSYVYNYFIHIRCIFFVL